MRRPGWSLAAVGGGTVAVLGLVGLLAPVLAPYDPRTLSGASLEAPSARHLLGTNDIGQDLASALVWGARSSLVVALGAAGLAVVLGVSVGLGTALVGGWIDRGAQRVIDVLLAVPVLPLLVLVAALVGRSRLAVIAVIGALAWPRMARVLRSQALSLRQRGYVQAAGGLGGSLGYVLRRHLVPAMAPLVVVNFVIVAGVAVLLESGLAFLGLGDPTAVSWGQILDRSLEHPGIYFSPAWTWWMLPPGLAITATVLGLTFLGVGLEPRFDVRLARGR